MADKRKNLLVGEIEELSLMAFRKGPGDIIAQVQMGKVFLLTKQGKPVAVLSRPPGEELVKTINREGEVSYDLPR